MEIKNATEALSKALSSDGDAELGEVESINRAELDQSYLQTIVKEPAAVLKALNIKVSDESQIQVTAKHRANRKPQAQRQRITIIIIHWRNCDTDIIIFL